MKRTIESKKTPDFYINFERKNLESFCSKQNFYQTITSNHIVSYMARKLSIPASSWCSSFLSMCPLCSLYNQKIKFSLSFKKLNFGFQLHFSHTLSLSVHRMLKVLLLLLLLLLIPSLLPADSGGGVLYVCMYACMHVCMNVCMYACMHVCIYACMHACVKNVLKKKFNKFSHEKFP